MGRKSKGSHRATAIIICLNDVKLRIPLDSEEKIQSKEKTMIIVKHLSKDFKKYKEKFLKTNYTPDSIHSQFHASEHKAIPNDTLIQNDNNYITNNQNKLFAISNMCNNYNNIEIFNTPNEIQIRQEEINNKNQLQELNKTNILNDIPPQTICYPTEYDLGSNNNSTNNYDLTDDRESEKIIAEWDRLWGDGCNSDDSTQLPEKELFFPDCLSSILI